MIRITPGISLREEEVHFAYIRASGPGGQKVNKSSTAVQLRFDLARSPSLPERVRRRLAKLAGRRLTANGEIVIEARRFRSREGNRKDALGRLVSLIRKAAEKRRPRHSTRPTASSRKARLDAKRRRGAVKRLRRPLRSTNDD